MIRSRKPAEGRQSFDDVFKAEREWIDKRKGQGALSALRGLALSGGGVRSAAVCLGVLQGLGAQGRLDRFHYLSTVSGGGYVGATLSACLSDLGGGVNPFDNEDFRDSDVVAHLRNNSNYLFPRDQSSLANFIGGAAVLLRGLIANAICVLAFMLPVVLLTVIAAPSAQHLADANFIPHLATNFSETLGPGLNSAAPPPLRSWLPPLLVPIIFAVLLGGVLILWAVGRSVAWLDDFTGDTRGLFVALASLFFTLLLASALLEASALGITALQAAADETGLNAARAAAVTLFGALASVATFAGRIGRFLKASSGVSTWGTTAKRAAGKLVLIAGSLILPVLLWLTYALLYLWVVNRPPALIAWSLSLPWTWDWDPYTLIIGGYLLSVAITLCLRANNYSLHWLYRDRLKRAFIVGNPDQSAEKDDDFSAKEGRHLAVRDKIKLKLTDLVNSKGPYPLINAALNVQGSLEANRRGRNAEFFLFSPLHVGSDLTGYRKTEDMQKADERLDLASSIAISGAAASANMGSRTVRLLSPTLSLLNVRLGYYLANPRYVGGNDRSRWVGRFADQFYLLLEMANLLDEYKTTVYLTDGGHIENLGLYQLLKRRCKTIMVVDAEADPGYEFGSLLLAERYARIDLGIRINLPWEEVASISKEVRSQLDDGKKPVSAAGPHCIVGRIQYPKTESEAASLGTLIYLKSSLSGDEKDYVLDYAKRNRAFPHESTSDQFFSEEQFEMYRALGFHMVNGALGTDTVAFVKGAGGYTSLDEVRAEINRLLS